MVHLCFIFAADNLIVEQLKFIYENTLNTAEKDLMNDVDEQLKTIKLWLDYSYYL